VLPLSRYLSPEPLLQDPRFVRTMLQAGVQVPSYAYAANSPLQYTDPDGLRITTTTRVSYDRSASYSRRPGAQVSDLSVGWDRGCTSDGKGGWKFDASVTAQINVRLAGVGDRPSLNDGNSCTIREHEDKHVDDFVDDISNIEKHFPSEGFRSQAECKAAFQRLNRKNVGDFVNAITESSRSRRDPFDYAR
jgi:hypothetical protein